MTKSAAGDPNEAREELADVAASLRAYLEWQQDTGASGIPLGVLRLPAQSHTGPAAENLHKNGVKGTVVLVAIFFVCFILYYFTNWMMLSFLWKVG